MQNKQPSGESITVSAYERAVEETNGGLLDKTSFAFGLAGEIGQLLSELKKQDRGDVGNRTEDQSIKEELGDCLWYLTAICQTFGSSLRECLNLENDADAIADFDHQANGLEIIELASCLLEESARIANPSTEAEEKQKALNKIAVALFGIASKRGMSIDDIAKENIAKTKGFFGPPPTDLKNLDEEYPKYEQFPRSMVFEIKEGKVGEDCKAMLFVDGVRYGDPLDDNISGEGDYYRYHDVFHMAFVAYLGWSPSLRALLNKKRRSNAQTDRNEDGGRPRLMEEGLTHYIFRYGERNKFFDGIDNPRVAISVLKTIKTMTEGYEVDDRPPSLWNEAILKAFEVFLCLKKHGGGRIIINMDRKKKLTFVKLKSRKA